jgi:hypothetical protein
MKAGQGMRSRALDAHPAIVDWVDVRLEIWCPQREPFGSDESRSLEFTLL